MTLTQRLLRFHRVSPRTSLTVRAITYNLGNLTKFIPVIKLLSTAVYFSRLQVTTFRLAVIRARSGDSCATSGVMRFGLCARTFKGRASLTSQGSGMLGSTGGGGG